MIQPFFDIQHVAAESDWGMNEKKFGGAGGGDELAAVASAFHIHQDRAGLMVPQQIIQKIAQVHIPAHTHRDDMGKADIAAVGPVNHAAHHRRRLTQQRDVARQWPGRVQTGVHIGRRHRVA